MERNGIREATNAGITGVRRTEEEIAVLVFLQLHFDYVDGDFICHTRPKQSKTLVGEKLGSPNGGGYLRAGIFGTKYYVHRLVWLWHFGVWPSNLIDHVDRDTRNNRIENLRDVLPHVNAANRNQSETRGVYEMPPWLQKPWMVQFVRKDAPIHRSFYETREEAMEVAARLRETTYKQIIGGE